MAWWRLMGQIEDVADEDQHGKVFCVGFYRSTCPGALKGPVRVLNGGIVAPGLEEVDQVLTSAPGTLVKVDVRTSTSKKDGNTYTNAFITDVVAMTDVDEISADAPEEATSSVDPE